MLNTKMAWRIARFFEGLGFDRDPQTGSVKIDWNAAVGKQGYVKIKVRDYQSNGETRQANDIDAYPQAVRMADGAAGRRARADEPAGARAADGAAPALVLRDVMGAVDLRPYQEEARRAVEREWDEGAPRRSLVPPHRCGKTIVFAMVAKDVGGRGRARARPRPPGRAARPGGRQDRQGDGPSAAAWRRPSARASASGSA